MAMKLERGEPAVALSPYGVRCYPGTPNQPSQLADKIYAQEEFSKEDQLMSIIALTMETKYRSFRDAVEELQAEDFHVNKNVVRHAIAFKLIPTPANRLAGRFVFTDRDMENLRVYLRNKGSRKAGRRKSA